MSNGSESLPEYPGRPDYTALIARVRKSPWATWETLAALADAVEALVAENEAYRKGFNGSEMLRKAAEAERDALRGQLAAAEAVIHRIEGSAAKPFGWLEYGLAVDTILAEYRSEEGNRV